MHAVRSGVRGEAVGQADAGEGLTVAAPQLLNDVEAGAVAEPEPGDLVVVPNGVRRSQSAALHLLEGFGGGRPVSVLPEGERDAPADVHRPVDVAGRRRPGAA